MVLQDAAKNLLKALSLMTENVATKARTVDSQSKPKRIIVLLCHNVAGILVKEVRIDIVPLFIISGHN